ncbi:Nucleolar protein 4 [Trichoplax sp. H2]|nr:Nucleolar protein 4 [Trichoplax sp. H2]|eukprot:RDD46975.1 Nucleolar protein 4 [Trichoplax sp. H2]
MNPIRRSVQEYGNPYGHHHHQSSSYKKITSNLSLGNNRHDIASSSKNGSSSGSNIGTSSYNHSSHLPLVTSYQSNHPYFLGHLPPFQDYLQRVWMNRPGRRCSSAISRSLHNKIVDYLQHNTSTTPKFKYWVKSKRFTLINNYLAVPAGTGRKRSKSTNKLFQLKSSSTSSSTQRSETAIRGYRRVAVIEDYEEIIQRYHCIEHEHAGIRRTYEMICQDYSYFPRAVVAKYLEFCPICSHRKQHESTTTSSITTISTSIPAISNPSTSIAVISVATEAINNAGKMDKIVSSGNIMAATTISSQYNLRLDSFMATGNILFIDMTHRPDEFHTWIGCYFDSWSNYCILFPLRNRSPQEVSRKLSSHIFAIFGLPKLLRCQLDGDYIQELVDQLHQLWTIRKMNIHIDQVRLNHHPIIHYIQHLLTIASVDKWVPNLPQIQYKLNNTSANTGWTPQQIVFNILPTWIASKS